MTFFARLKSDFAYIAGGLRILKKVGKVARDPGYVFPNMIEELAETYASRPALLNAFEQLTYDEFNRRGNRYARWAQANGIEKGDCVALLMTGRPEFLACWLGVIRAGGVCALQNHNLTGKALAHCIDIVNPKHVVVGNNLVASLKDSLDFMTTKPKIWVKDRSGEFGEDLDAALDGYADDPIAAEERPKLQHDDRALFIYTSGTTGLPKAANINHYRLMAIANGFSAVMGLSDRDRIYIALPLYHTNGGIWGACAPLTVGASSFVRGDFSAREFWSDIIKYECTTFAYIGELCRYLVNTPSCPEETQHAIRLCCGNGLRPDIWRKFKERFKIPQIVEFYGATEGNVVLFNFDGKEGAIGRVPKILERRFVNKVVRFDYESEQPVRNENGHCIECAPNEVGEVIGQILNDPSRPSQRFEGYANKKATESKILENAFEAGDRWFRTGDLMRKDELGYFYFIDRIGDTFRWKGENVATSEVAETLAEFPDIREATVFGVEVPGCDGKAGMAAVVANDTLDFSALHEYLRDHLPSYARPLFLRMQKEIEVTSTFKYRKVDLVKEGFDPNKISDPLYFNDTAQGGYVPLDAALYEKLQSGALRL